VVTPSWLKYDDRYLLARLKSTAELLREVGDPDRPYYTSEWSGVDRQTQYGELSDECKLIIDECTRRALDWYEAYWGEPRRARQAG
jgi:hypothetical protein